MIDFSTLNVAQRDAVFSDNPRILCLAGAGTGKTQVLTRRVARLWEAGNDPAAMLALTFTRAAGAEMKERVIGLIGDDGKRLFCNTFHAFCVEVIRENAAAIGYDESFSIYDQTTQDELLAEVIADLKYRVTAKQVRDVRNGNGAALTPTLRAQIGAVLKEYEYRLKRNNAFDFDGLIDVTRWWLRDTSAAAVYRERYKYVFVDEFQDTDAAQWEIVNSIQPENLFVVGDDFQSIYGFRGSDIGIILELAENPDWQTVKLEQNYRSTESIIAAANALIRHNRQTEKTLVAQKDGADVEYREPDDDETEILDEVRRLQQNIADGVTTAVLARTNRQLERAREILKRCGVPCDTSSAAQSPLTSNAAKTVFAWLAALENGDDDVVMRKLAGATMSRAEIQRVEAKELSEGGTFINHLPATEAGAAFIAIYNDTLSEYGVMKDYGKPPSEIVDMLIDNNLEASDGEPWGLTEAVTAWETRQTELGEPTGVQDLLNWVRICNVAEKSADEILPDKIHLMTVHGSKGLEFDEVYVIGAAQGAFPNRGDIEEERRLFYVAVTRARERLNISRPLCMEGWNGDRAMTERSQFISEAIPSL